MGVVLSEIRVVFLMRPTGHDGSGDPWDAN
jgi:hypothetical protein